MESENRSSNEPVTFAADLHLSSDDDTLGFATLSQTPHIPLPRALENLGTSVRLSEQSRAYVIGLPQEGLTLFARELNTAMDARTLPVNSIGFFVSSDPDEGHAELVARVEVALNEEDALEQWEELDVRYRSNLPSAIRARMRREFAFEIDWPDIK